MTNLKPKGKDRYEYHTAETGAGFDVSLYYTKGGANYFSGGMTRRGIYISITPTTREDGCVSFTMFSGKGAFLLDQARFNAKTLAEVAEAIDFIVPAAANKFPADNADAVELIRAYFEAARLEAK